jgi:Major capsid protein Gp23
MTTRQELVKKWAPILEHADLPQIKDNYRKEVTAQLLENQEKAAIEERKALFEDAPTNSGGTGVALGGAGTNANMAGYDPVLISLVRRAAPAMIAYDMCGVQPMTQPTGLIFAMKSKYDNQAGAEALFNEADSDWSGKGDQQGTNPADLIGGGTYTNGTPITTAEAEAQGSGNPNLAFKQMAFSIEKTSVTAESRALKAEYSVELAQDLKAVHGLSAEAELSKILSDEILAEINREVIRKVYIAAKVGAQTGTASAGVFDLDVDSNGRWSVEKFKGLLFQIEREANAIYQQTRRGRGNFIVCSADVASALAMAGVLDYAPALSTNLNVDEASNTFAGVLNGKYKVYVDPYAANQTPEQFLMVGYKGTSAFDAGAFYCPYVPLQQYKAVDPATFQPKIAFRTRYGFVANPFTSMTSGQNIYFRKVKVTNLM